MKVIITGATGFIGSNLAASLIKKNLQVFSLGRNSGGEGYQGIDMQTGNAAVLSSVDLPDYFKGIDAVVHLAAKQVDSLSEPLQAYIPSNVVLTENVTLNALTAGVKRMVFASTRLVYPAYCQETFAEDCPYEPDTMYGLSKKIGESIIDHYTRKHKTTGISLRLAQVFGPGDKHRGAVGRFIQQAADDGKLTVFGQGSAFRDFIYIKDVVSAFETAILSDVPSGVYNIGSHQGYSIKDIASAVCEAYLDGNESIKYTPVQNEDQTRYVMDCTKARKHLKWQPGWSLKEALLDMKMGQ